MKGSQKSSPKKSSTQLSGKVIPTPPSKPSVLLFTVICLALTLATVLVYAQTFWHDYVFYDDDWYVYDNPHIKTGLTLQSLSWSFTTFYFANWHPLTWISYMLDYQLFGLSPGAGHAVNVLLHLGSVILLFFTFQRMTRRSWASAILAGVFALHPLHVESVAWIAERKDVLSTFFLIATLFLYVRYVEKPSWQRYVLTAVFLALSLLAKPMAVTVPFLLLLLDFWPLQRLAGRGIRFTFNRLIWEKAPFLAMSIVVSVLTFYAQRSFGAVASLSQVPFTGRLANAVVSYVSYIGKAFWPSGLAVLYPPRDPSGEAVLGCALLLLAITVLALKTIQTQPYLLVGWLWYAGMLVPVIGLVQVGLQSMADRYTYVPLVGLSIPVIWGLAEILNHRPVLRPAGAALGIVVLLASAAGAYKQASFWKNSKTLFEHTLAVTNKNSVIENNLGVVLQREGKYPEAATLFRKALIGFADYPAAHANLGHELLRSGQFEEAFSHVSRSLALKSDSAEPQADMGLLLAIQGKFEEAEKHLQTSIGLEPASSEAQSNYCYVLQHIGKVDAAIAACTTALKLKPDSLDARYNLGTAFAANGQPQAAAVELSRVLTANPNYAAARNALERLPHPLRH